MTGISYSTDRTFSTFRITEAPTSRKLLDVYRDALRVKHYSARTEDTYVFPASDLSTDKRTGIHRRHHIHETVVQKAIREAARRAKIDKHVTPHTLRHSFATHLLQNNYDTQHLRLWAGVRTIQELLGHKACPELRRGDVKTTMIYTHALRVQRGGLAVKSPLDN